MELKTEQHILKLVSRSLFKQDLIFVLVEELGISYTEVKDLLSQLEAEDKITETDNTYELAITDKLRMIFLESKILDGGQVDDLMEGFDKVITRVLESA